MGPQVVSIRSMVVAHKDLHLKFEGEHQHSLENTIFVCELIP